MLGLKLVGLEERQQQKKHRSMGGSFFSVWADFSVVQLDDVILWWPFASLLVSFKIKILSCCLVLRCVVDGTSTLVGAVLSFY